MSTMVEIQAESSREADITPDGLLAIPDPKASEAGRNRSDTSELASPYAG